MKSHKKLLKYAGRRFLLGLIAISLVGLIGGITGSRLLRPGGNNSSVSAASCPATICVALTQKGMSPDEIAIRVGDSVQFNSADGKRHHIAEGEGRQSGTEGSHHHTSGHEHIGDFLSDEFGADEAWRVQFNKTGVYKLHDHLNPALNILVVVY